MIRAALKGLVRLLLAILSALFLSAAGLLLFMLGVSIADLLYGGYEPSAVYLLDFALGSLICLFLFLCFFRLFSGDLRKVWPGIFFAGVCLISGLIAEAVDMPEIFKFILFFAALVLSSVFAIRIMRPK